MGILKIKREWVETVEVALGTQALGMDRDLGSLREDVLLSDRVNFGHLNGARWRGSFTARCAASGLACCPGELCLRLLPQSAAWLNHCLALHGAGATGHLCHLCSFILSATCCASFTLLVLHAAPGPPSNAN
jgi:hypothetical protein